MSNKSILIIFCSPPGKKGLAAALSLFLALGGGGRPPECAGAVDYGLEFSKGLGLTNLTGLETARPWEIAVWFGGGSQAPLPAIKAPVKDMSRFRV